MLQSNLYASYPKTIQLNELQAEVFSYKLSFFTNYEKCVDDIQHHHMCG